MQSINPHKMPHNHQKPAQECATYRTKHSKAPKKPHFCPSYIRQWGSTSHTQKPAKNPQNGANTGANNTHPPSNQKGEPLARLPNPSLATAPPAILADVYNRIKEVGDNQKRYFGTLQTMCQHHKHAQDLQAVLAFIDEQMGELFQALDEDVKDILTRLEPFCEAPFDTDDDLPFT